MQNLQAKLAQFKELDFQQKYNIVFSMLEILKDGDEIFLDFYNLLSSLKDETSEDLLITIYELITTAMVEIENEKTENEVKKLEKLKTKLQKLKEMEEKQEGDPEKLLENI